MQASFQTTIADALGASIQHVFSSMMQLSTGVGVPTEKCGPLDAEAAATIRVSGDLDGWITLCFPIGTARRCVARLTGQDLEPASPDFADALGEIANMVCGSAKATLATHDAHDTHDVHDVHDVHDASISPPSVTLGWKLAPTPLHPAILIPCTTPCGDVNIAFSITTRKNKKPDASKQAA
jgi:chemotaxis protein CheX